MMAAERAVEQGTGQPPSGEDASRVEETILFGVRFSNLTFDGLCRWLDAQIALKTPAYVVTPNVDHVCRLHHDTEFQEAYAHAALRLPDGVPLMWCARLLGRPLREKLSGSDLVPRLTAYAAEKGYRVFFLGAAEGVAEEAAAKLREIHPALKVAGCFSPPLGFEKSEAQNLEAVRCVRKSEADICFVALGSPKQESWLLENAASMRVPVVVGIGAGLDFVAGRVRRAPVWLQRLGCEWIWRLVHEPRRLWRRYLVHDSHFFILLLKEFVRHMRKQPQTGEDL